MGRYDDEYDYEEDDRPRRRRHQDDEGDYDFRKRDLPHSGIGVASLVIAVVGGLAIFFVFAIAGVMEEETPGGLDENSPAAMLLGLIAVGLLGLIVIGLGLGIGGLVQKDRNKLFGMLGLAGNALVILGSGALMCAGAMMG
jgi:hypothetical protein